MPRTPPPPAAPPSFFTTFRPPLRRVADAAFARAGLDAARARAPPCSAAAAALASRSPAQMASIFASNGATFARATVAVQRAVATPFHAACRRCRYARRGCDGDAHVDLGPRLVPVGDTGV